MKRRITSNKFFLFQRATRGIEKDVYETLIAPYENDLPASLSDGLRRVCADHKYAFYGYNLLNTEAVKSVSCNIVPLPNAFYTDAWAFLITKNSPYKGLINWRWDNEIKSTRYTTDSSLQLWVPRKLPSTKRHVHILFRNKSFNLRKLRQVCSTCHTASVLLVIIWNL